MQENIFSQGYSQHFQLNCLSQIHDLAIPSTSKIYMSWKLSSSVNVPGSDSICNYVSQSLAFNWSRSELFVWCHLCCNFFKHKCFQVAELLDYFFIKLIIMWIILALHLHLAKYMSISYKSAVGRVNMEHPLNVLISWWDYKSCLVCKMVWVSWMASIVEKQLHFCQCSSFKGCWLKNPFYKNCDSWDTSLKTVETEFLGRIDGKERKKWRVLVYMVCNPYM